jgi:hypothetical protein
MAEKTTFDNIIIKGDVVYIERPLEALDAYGDGFIMPGMLIERTNTGTVQPHSTSTGLAAPKMFAVEFANDGRGVDDAYVEDGEVVRYGVPCAGAEIYAFLAAGEDINGTTALLESNGDGYLKVGTTNPVARALEDVDNDPGTDDAPARIKVEVL